MWRTGDHHRRGLLLAVGPGHRARSPRRDDVRGRRRPHARGVARPRRADPSTVSHATTCSPVRVHRDADAAGVTARYGPAPSARRAVGRRRRWTPIRHAWIEKYAIGLSQSIHVLHLTDWSSSSARSERLRPASRRSPKSVRGCACWTCPSRCSFRSSCRPATAPTGSSARSRRYARQSYAHWELLVVDDASTDDTWTRLDGAGRRRSPHPSVPARHRNSDRRRRGTRRSTTPRAM